MRILYLVPDLLGPPGGIARYCHMVCQGLRVGNAKLTVVALHDLPGKTADAMAMFGPIEYYACGSKRAVFIKSALAALRTSRPDVVLIGHPNFSFLGWTLARISRARMVSFMYGIDVWRVLPALRGWAFRKADDWISISRFTAQRASTANNVRLDKIYILHNCLDPELQPQVIVGEQAASPSLLTVARISLAQQHKGQDYVIRSLPALLGKFPTLIYHIVGGGDGTPWLEGIAAEERVTHAVQFHGVVSDEELAGYYKDASIYVMPSRGEGFGFVFLEAMAHGKPVIAGNKDAAVEVIKHGETGLLVDPTSVDELGGAIDLLLSNAQLRQEMGVRGIETVKRDFSFERFQQNLMKHLREVAK